MSLIDELEQQVVPPLPTNEEMGGSDSILLKSAATKSGLRRMIVEQCLALKFAGVV